MRSQRGALASITRLVLALFILLGLLSGSALAPAVGQTPPVRVGVYQNEPKVFRDAGGRVTGFFPEILELIAAAEGWRLEYVDGTWSECLARLEAGEIDQPGINMAIVWRYVSMTILAAAIVLIFFLAWNYRLKREILVRVEAQRRLAEQSRELERANDRLMELDRLKSVFMASMSHELRTPLNSIIGFTGLLLLDMAGPVNQEQRKQLGMVKASAEHLLNLINEILDISRIEAGRLQLEPVEFALEELLEEIADTLAPLAGKKGLAVTVKAPGGLRLHADRRRFKQVLINLAGNAVKFTELGSVALEARVESGRVITVIADTGPGIRQEDLAGLFQPFQQVDMSTTKKHEGSGLGLYLCRKIMTLLGGTVTAESVLGAGSRFIVTLPIKGKSA